MADDSSYFFNLFISVRIISRSSSLRDLISVILAVLSATGYKAGAIGEQPA